MQNWIYITIAIIVVLAIITALFVFKNNKQTNDVTKNESQIKTKKFADGEISDKILHLLGGVNNIENMSYCKTRIKFELKQAHLASFDNDDYVNCGVAGIISRNNNKIDVIIGFEVEEVASQIKEKLR